MIENKRYISGIVLCVLIWLWPYTHGPLSQVWPNLVAWVCGFVFFLFVYRADNAGKKTIIDGLLWAAVVSAIIALAQYFDIESVFEPLVATTVPGYAYANTRQTNHLASLMVIGIGVSLWKMASKPLESKYFCFALLLVTALAATASRGGVVQLLLALLIGSYYLKSVANVKLIAIVLLGAYFALSWILPELYEMRFSESSPRNLFHRVTGEGGCSSRFYLWGNVIELIGMRPLTGWGWDGLKYAHYDNIFSSPRFCDLLSNAHNLILQLAVSVGIPIALAVGFVAIYFVAKQKPFCERDEDAQIAWMILCVVGFHQMVEYPLWFGNFQVTVVMALFILLERKLINHGWHGSGYLLQGVFGRVWVFLLFLGLVFYYSFSYVKTTQLFLPKNERLEYFRDDTRQKVGMPWFFDDQILFAYVVTTDPEHNNARELLDASLAALRVSPEPRVIERVIVSAAFLGNMELAQYHELRYKAAWPEYYEKWVASQNFQKN